MRRTFDRFAQVVSNDQQRRILCELLDRESRSISVDEIAPERATRLEHWHHHLPKLDSYGLIEWDRETARIDRGPAFAEIEPMIAAIGDRRQQ